MRFLKRVYAFLDRTDGSLQHRALRSGVWVGVSSIGIVVLSFLRGIIMARLLTPEIFGLMAVSLMATRLIEIFTETGFGAALIHRQQRFEDARDTAFTMMVLRGVGLATISFVIAPFVAAFYKEPVVESIVRVVGISFILTGCQNINTVALQKDLNFKRLTYLELTNAILGFAVAVGFAWWLRSVWALVYTQIATAAINAVMSFVIVPERVRLRFDWAIAKELYGYGRFITGLAIVVFFTRELDNAVIGKLIGVELLGYYVAAYTLANIPSTYLAQIVTKVLFPVFSTLQNDLAKLRTEYSRGIRLITAVAVPASVSMMVLAPEIVRALYGAKWAQAAVPLRILAIFGCFRALWMLNGYLYNAIGRPYIDFYLSLSRLVVMAALLFPLTMWYGIAGAAVAVTLPMAAQFAVGVYLSRRLIKAPIGLALRPLSVAAGRGLVLAAVLFVAKFVVASDPKLALLSLMTVGGIVCVALNLRDLRSLLSAAGAR
ncbi:MAG TPA: lipopolysaccharide biosynthesis protein [Vicinamibacterales bacterium]|nr:lipopolysaccharide biosynthesis protein [Vicinamibacterales bacterium]